MEQPSSFKKDESKLKDTAPIDFQPPPSIQIISEHASLLRYLIHVDKQHGYLEPYVARCSKCSEEFKKPNIYLKHSCNPDPSDKTLLYKPKSVDPPITDTKPDNPPQESIAAPIITNEITLEVINS